MVTKVTSFFGNKLSMITVLNGTHQHVFILYFPRNARVCHTLNFIGAQYFNTRAFGATFWRKHGIQQCPLAHLWHAQPSQSTTHSHERSKTTAACPFRHHTRKERACFRNNSDSKRKLPQLARLNLTHGYALDMTSKPAHVSLAVFVLSRKTRTVKLSLIASRTFPTRRRGVLDWFRVKKIR